MTRDILYIHGAGDTGEEPDSLFGYLSDHLSGSYGLQRPQMPEDPMKWVDAIERLVAPLGEDAILIGHSFGGTCLLQYIATRNPGLRAAALVLVAPPFWGQPEWEVDEFVLPEDFAASLSGIGQVYHLHSRDDEVASFAHQAVYKQAMPEAVYLAFDDCGHAFDRGDRAPLLEMIRGL